MVVVAGDHGESLGERGERDHGIFIYENVLRVPLIMRAPGLAPGRFGDVVGDRRHADDPRFAGRAGSRGRFYGISPVPLMSGRTAHLDLEVFAESVQPERLAGARSRRCAPAGSR